MVKNHLIKNRVLQVLAVFWAIGFYSVAQAQVEVFTVQLRLDTNQTKLDVTSVGRCSSNNHNGCVEVPHKKQARVKFLFVEDRQCNRPGGDKWEVGEVYLGGKNSAKKPSDDPQDPPVWGNLDAAVEADFNVADALSGLLNKEHGSGKNSMVIFDKNILPYDIWYKVTIVCVDSAGSVIDTVEFDPRIKNGGSE